MNCHDILCISERASASEIERAYSERLTQIQHNAEKNAKPEAFERKKKELEQAKRDCVEWQTLPLFARSKKRLAENAKSFSSPNRLNEVCFGPCTCVDSAVGLCLKSGCGDCCGENGSVAENICGSQKVCVFVDVAIYVVLFIQILIAVLRKAIPAIKRGRANRAIRDAANAESENIRLNAQLIEERRKLQELTAELENMEAQSKLLQTVGGFLGKTELSPNAPIAEDAQRARMAKKKNQITMQRARCSNIESRIKQNLDIISRAGR